MQQSLLDLFLRAQHEDPAALYQLGQLYAAGQQLPYKPNEAFAHFRQAAEFGLAQASYQVGRCYHEGIGVKPDKAKAGTWFRRAAEADDPEGQWAVGRWLAEECTAPSYGPAFAWYALSAKNGSLEGMIRLATCHADGIGTPLDIPAAFTLYQSAIEQGSEKASIFMNELLRRGVPTLDGDVKYQAYPDGTRIYIPADPERPLYVWKKRRAIPLPAAS